MRLTTGRLPEVFPQWLRRIKGMITISGIRRMPGLTMRQADGMALTAWTALTGIHAAGQSLFPQEK